MDDMSPHASLCSSDQVVALQHQGAADTLAQPIRSRSQLSIMSFHSVSSNN